jgi:endonuclease YncB( thermonuclease family)
LGDVSGGIVGHALSSILAADAWAAVKPARAGIFDLAPAPSSAIIDPGWQAKRSIARFTLKTGSAARVITMIFCAATLAACGKAIDQATDRVIEAQAAKSGVQAKVDRTDEGMVVSVTDAKGQSAKVQMGGVQATEAEVGVPFYPGASIDAGGSTKTESAAGTAWMVRLTSKDAPARVAEFYRDKLKSQGDGKGFAEIGSGPGQTMLVLEDRKARRGVQVQVGPADGGSQIQIVATQGTAKAK